MLNRLIAVVLLLHLTNLFTVLPGIAGRIPFLSNASIRTISATILAICVAYCAFHCRLILRLLVQDRVFLLLVVYLFGWPLVCTLWTDQYDTTLDCLVLQFYCLVLVFTTAIYVMQCGLSCYYQLLALSLAVTGVGFLVSIEYLPAMTALRGVETDDFEYLGRATGFYFQPNSAAYSVTYLWTGLVPAMAAMSRWKQASMLALLAVLVVLTASRGGLFVAGATAVLFVAVFFGYRDPGVAVVAGMASFMIAFLLVARYDLIERATFDTPLERVAVLAGGLLDGTSTVLEEDGSFRDRAEVQAEYIAECYARPLGYGAGAVLHNQSSGGFEFTTHSYYISTAYEYGLPAIMLYLYLVSNLYRVFRDRPLLAMVLVPMILSGLFYASLFALRVLPVILGGHLVAGLADLREPRCRRLEAVGPELPVPHKRRSVPVRHGLRPSTARPVRSAHIDFIGRE